MPDTQQYNSLLSEIEKKASREAAMLTARSEEKLKQKTAELETKKQQILSQIQAEQDNRLQQLARTLQSHIDMEKRRNQLKLRGTVMKEIQERVYAEMRKKIKEQNYPQILADWICEAVSALPGEQFIITAGREEAAMLNADFLEKIAEKAAKTAGRNKVSLTLNNKEYLLEQGVVISLPDNKLQFSNTVSDRWARCDSQIRTYIFETIFKSMN